MADNLNLPRPDMTMAEELMFRLYAVMEDDGGGKGGEYLLMADNVVTPVHNENMDKEMEMVSEPYELQPLGMDSFAPPTHPDLPPTHPDLPPTHSDLPPTHPDIPPTHPDIPPTHSDPAPPARLDSLPSAPQGVPQGVPEGYLSYPAAPHRGEGVHPSNPAQLVNNHQQQLQQQQRQLGSLVTDNNMMPQSNEYMQNTRIPPQQNTHPMFLMNQADIMNSSGGSTPVGSNESLSVGSPAGTPDLSGRQPPDLSGRQPPDLSGRQPPKHSVLAAASAKSRRKHDRIMPVESAETKEKYVCPVCKMELFTASSLTKHIRSHNATTPTATNVNSCTICGKVLSSQSSLDRHMLVHSGERPFKCRFCNMSFTTNGNMHRHTRIHEKEGDTPLSQQNNNNAPHSNAIVSKQNRVHSNGSFMPSNGGSSQQQNIPPNRFSMDVNGSPVSVPGVMGLPRRTSRSPGNSRPQSPARAAAKRRLEEREPGEVVRAPGEGSELHPNKRPAREGMQTLSGAVDPTSPMAGMQALAMSTPVAPVFPYLFPAVQSSPSPDGNNNRRQKGSRPDEISDSEDKQVRIEGQGESQGRVSGSSSASSSPAARAVVPVGFSELCFTEFTADKFALIARSFCERNPRRASSIFFNFTCIDCNHAFPCPSALAVHRNTHIPGSTVNCAECQCWFDNPAQQRAHQLKHMGQKVIEYFSAATKDKDIEDVQQEISKEEFLCSMGLQLAKKEERPKIHNAFPRFDQKVNRDYFTRFNQINFSEFAQVARGFIDVKQEPTEEDFADINQILKVTSSSGVPHIASRSTLLPRSAHQRLSITAGNSDLLSDLTADGKETFICKFCGEKFENLRNYKGHVRSHLGLAAYKCNLCSYSSADKSTLIRHLRTHNGERPFRCLVCQFAFTTKANCERHVRKKHAKSGKQEIEDCIGYNESPAEGVADVDAFASPDTVCKYCGEDFKFFRALKHHLRSHSSCRSKPYVCRLCTTGFSTKANCVRHIQKQHMEVSQSQLEDCIQVNEMLLQEGRDETHESEEGGRSACSSPAGSYRLSPLPPPAHMSSPRGRCSVHTSPRASFIGTSPLAGMRREWGSADQPIDFSMKSAHSSPVPAHHGGLMTLTPGSSAGGDEPMDLSTHSRSSSSSCESSPAPGALRTRGHGVPFQPSAYSLQLSANLQVHLRSHTNERPFICNLCNAGFTIKTNLERHLKTRHGADFHPDLMSTKSCDSIVAGDHDYYGQLGSDDKVVAMETNNNYPDKPCNTSSCYPGSQTTSAINASIAAYKKMFGSDQYNNTTNKHTALESTVSETDARQKAVELAHQSHLSGGGMSVVRPTEINNNDETAEGLHAKLKDRGFYMAQQAAKTKQLLAAKLLERQSGSGLQELPEMQPQIPTIRVMDNKGLAELSSAGAGDGDVRKKRNSYADSPHRLVCPYCPRAFPWISSLNRHILTHTGQKPFKCPQCPVMFSTKSNRERHLVRKHGLNVLDPATRQMMDRPFKCHLCVFSSFSTSGNLIRHYKEKHPETEPPDHIIAAGEAALKEQQENGAVLNDSDDLVIDEEESSSRPPSPVRPAVSVVASSQEDGDAAQVKRIIMEHMINNPPPRVSTPYTPPDTPDRGINPERDNYNVDKITDCWVCANTFDSRKSLLRHLKEHNIDLPYKCYLCDASFNARIECLQHKHDQHSGDWNVLKDKNHIDQLEHFVRVMNAIVNQNLGASADTSADDYKVTGEDLMKYRVSMGEDMKPESDYTQRKVYCSLCPKRFWSLQDLRRHMRSHTGEKPFECDVCQKRFTLKHSMVRHRRKHAGAEAGAATLSASDDENTSEDVHPNLKRGSTVKIEPAQPADQPAAKIRRLGDGTQAVLFNLRGGIGSLGGLGSDSSDLLQNLLGVEETAIDRMLDSNADSAAKLLGVK